MTQIVKPLRRDSIECAQREPDHTREKKSHEVKIVIERRTDPCHDAASALFNSVLVIAMMVVAIKLEWITKIFGFIYTHAIRSETKNLNCILFQGLLGLIPKGYSTPRGQNFSWIAQDSIDSLKVHRSSRWLQEHNTFFFPGSLPEGLFIFSLLCYAGFPIKEAREGMGLLFTGKLLVHDTALNKNLLGSSSLVIILNNPAGYNILGSFRFVMFVSGPSLMEQYFWVKSDVGECDQPAENTYGTGCNPELRRDLQQSDGIDNDEMCSIMVCGSALTS
ncbi:hypothetical protein pdam_00024077 [Pocillopora damicornis]|uniref:Uncharacterized protein n=1 Tax=Pocillopora damicornis TaxID=46731 RepID=A0A3M6U5S6_POCDA|nr:hypothetical protein pdam_00024077 [Pocillopora damicornis]